MKNKLNRNMKVYQCERCARFFEGIGPACPFCPGTGYEITGGKTMKIKLDNHRNMKKTIFNLHPQHYEWLKAISEKTGASMSWHIRRLINAEMERTEKKG